MREPRSELADVAARLRTAGCVFAEDEARDLVAAARTPRELDRLVAHRVSGMPLEQVVGWAEFCGHRIPVEPGVFVPRQRSGLIVAEALARARPRSSTVVLDLCCGTGALGAAVAAGLPGPVELHAADIDPDATRCARRTVAPYGGRVHTGDLYAALPERLLGTVHLLLCNAPYVPTAAIALLPPEARLHEPRSALDGGADGLDLHRRVATGASRWLARGGLLLLESSGRQAQASAAVVRAAGLRVTIRREEERDATVVVGTSV